LSSALCQVVVNAPLGRKLLAYECPPASGPLRPGDAVVVPLGSRECAGWVIRTDISVSELEIAGPLKSIIEKIEGGGVRPEDLRLCEAMHAWYGTNFPDILSLFVPPVAPKLVRRIVQVLDAPPTGLSPAAAQLAELVQQAGGKMDVRRAKTAFGAKPASAFQSALQELTSAAAYAVRPELLSTTPRQKKFLGPVQLPSGRTDLSASEKMVLTLADQHPWQYGVAELAGLAQTSTHVVRSLVARRLLLERASRKWRTPLERDDVAQVSAPEVVPTPSQARAIGELVPAVRDQTGEFFLLYGPTASGKTHVYEAAAKEALRLGRQVLLMVPEIALTRPLIERIRRTIHEPVAVVHSRQTPAERRDEWERSSTGEARLLVGPRSAAFVPLPEIGLAIIDECHDAGYKQSESPYLDARRVVEEKCAITRAPLIVGSATPAVEQWHEAEAAGGPRYRRLDLTEFPTRVSRPVVSIVDLGKLPASKPQTDLDRVCRQSFLSPVLQGLIEETLARRQACVLLMNRRGFAPQILCPACGHTETCGDCLMAMVYHAQDRQISCHGCGARRNPPAACPACAYAPLGYMGAGTERIVEACRARFPSARVARLDQDSFRKNRRRAFETLEDLKNGRLDILIGTQMIAKGLDVEHVSLSAVILADVGLNMPDYRAREKTFQLLAQLIGRSGRHGIPGRAVLQTFQPASPAIVLSAQEEAPRFVESELESRKAGHWPPFFRILRIVSQSSNAPRALQVIRKIYEHMTSMDFLSPRRGERNEVRGVDGDDESLPPSPQPSPAGGGRGEGMIVSPPLPCVRAKWKGEYRFQIIARLPWQAPVPHGLLDEIVSRYRTAGVKIMTEPDPVSLL